MQFWSTVQPADSETVESDCGKRPSRSFLPLKWRDQLCIVILICFCVDWGALIGGASRETTRFPESYRFRIDLNHPRWQEWALIPGIGPVLAQRIVDRQPFKRIEGLLDVRGIGPKRLSTIRAYVRVDEGKASRRRRND